MKNLLNRIPVLMLLLLSVVFVAACNDDDDDEPMLRSETFVYTLNEGQTAGAATTYDGEHPRNFSARMEIQEMPNGTAKVIVNLENTISGEVYHMHAHDFADPATTPNGTPFNETPNDNVLAQMITAQGTSATVEQSSTMSYDDLLNSYEGFFVVHDPTQPISTVDLTTYLILEVVGK